MCHNEEPERLDIFHGHDVLKTLVGSYPSFAFKSSYFAAFVSPGQILYWLFEEIL